MTTRVFNMFDLNVRTRSADGALEARLHPVAQHEDGIIDRDYDTLLATLPLPNSTADSHEVDDWTPVQVTPHGLAWDLADGIELDPDEFLQLVGIMVEHVNAWMEA